MRKLRLTEIESLAQPSSDPGHLGHPTSGLPSRHDQPAHAHPCNDPAHSKPRQKHTCHVCAFGQDMNVARTPRDEQALLTMAHLPASRVGVLWE